MNLAFPGESSSSQRSNSTSGGVLPLPQMPANNTMSSTDHKIIRKRNRVPLSCNFCRQRKLKCNRGHPCENCIKRGEESSCVYLVGNNANHAASQAASQQGLSSQLFGGAGPIGGTKRPSGAELQNRLDKLESLVLGLMHTSTGETDSPTDSNGEDSPASSSRQHPKSTGELAPDVDAVQESLGMMKLDKKGKAMYHGETHWGALLNELSEVKALFDRSRQFYDDGTQQTAWNDDPQTTFENAFPFYNPKGLERTDILALIPTRAEVDVLIVRYFEFFDPIYHIIHRQVFEQEYNAFWKEPDDIDIVWIGMLLCMMAVALQSYRPNDVPQQYRGRELQTWMNWQRAAEMCLVEGDFMLKGSINIMRTLILSLMVETRKTLNRQWMDRTWVCMGVIIRIAQSMGLHRDPKWFNISPYEAEMRRRIWSVVTSLDILFSINEGLPLTIRTGEHDVRMPLNINDEDITLSSTTIPQARPWDVQTSSAFLLCLSKMSSVLCQIVSGTFSLRPRPSYDTILAHDAELRATFASFPEYLRVPPESSGPLDPPYIVMQRFILDIQFRKSLIVLHRPFAARAQVNSKFKRSKEECLDASIHVIRRQNWLYNAPVAETTLCIFSWFTDGLMLSHFFHACIMLGVELYTNMDSMSAFQRQTVRDALDASRQIHAELGRLDMSAAKKHGLIESLFDRFHEMEKLTPEARAKIQAQAIRRQQENCRMDSAEFNAPDQIYESNMLIVLDKADGTHTISCDCPTPSISPSLPIQQIIDIQPTSQTYTQMDTSSSYDGMFLPEEEEIYMDAPYRMRKLPDPTWLQQMYGSPERHGNSVSPQASGPANGVFINGVHVVPNGEDSVSAVARNMSASSQTTSIAPQSNPADGSVLDTPDVVNGIGSILTSPDMKLLSQTGMMLSPSPGNEMHNMNWEEWNMYLHGVGTNTLTDNWVLSNLEVTTTSPDGAAGTQGMPVLWNPSMGTGLTPEPSNMMDISADGSLLAKRNGGFYDSGHTNM
ncbi:fungal-specific transcription factor domain-containing protein [Limtongia smithiae]|uniref:fungal-specific transcription factor domain-containing protein n=1 Tax=Limtongia smithiae TaxID=1125753 RepID=UPI0034CF1A40